ncbi:MAG: S-layer homology domain-containing protein [Thermaerobacter sp.]|nr:S-layer homology domain-containing protein [Thermaerobacter sp.]
MRRYRKALVIVTAIAMVLGSMGMAFAQTTTTTTSTTSTTSGPVTYTDVTSSTPHAASIYELTAMGIVSGVGNGLFDPTGNLTRADFAAIVDIAMMGQGAQSTQAAAASSPSGFTDVPAGQWYTGWVNLAVSKGYFHGEGGGLFDPNGNVTYAQVATVLDHMLGYGPVIDNQPWPNGAMGEASALGLFNGITSSSGTAAITRADMAKMLSNSLNQYMAYTEYYSNGTSRITEGSATNSKTLAQYALNDYMYTPQSATTSYTPVSGTGTASGSGTTGIVTGVPAVDTAVPAGEIQIDGTNFTVAPNAQFIDQNGNQVNESGLWGYQVEFTIQSSTTSFNYTPSTTGLIPYNTNSQVVFVRAVPGDSVVNGVTYAGAAPATVSTLGLTLQPNQLPGMMPGATSYQAVNVAIDAISGGLAMNINPNPDTHMASASLSNTLTVNAVLDSAGQVTGIIDTTQNLGSAGAVITGVSSGVVSYYYGPKSPTPNSVTPTSSTVITLNGQPSSVSALAANDVAFITTQNNGTSVTAINAFNTNVTGTITSVQTGTTSSGALRIVSVVMNGTTYNVAGPALVTENGTWYAAKASSQENAEVQGLVGASVTLYFGSTSNTGTVYYIASTTSTYPGGILVNSVYTNSTSVVLDLNGTQQTYDFASGYVPVAAGFNTLGELDPILAYPQGDWLRLTTNLNGQVTDVQDLGNAFAGAQGIAVTQTTAGGAVSPSNAVTDLAVTLNTAQQLSLGSVANVGPTGITLTTQSSPNAPPNNLGTYMVGSGIGQYNVSGGPTVVAPATTNGTSGITINQTNVAVVPSIQTPGSAKAILAPYTGQTATNWMIVTGETPNFVPGGNGSATPTYSLNVLMGGAAMSMTASQTTLESTPSANYPYNNAILNGSGNWNLGTDSNGNMWGLVEAQFTGTTITSIVATVPANTSSNGTVVVGANSNNADVVVGAVYVTSENGQTALGIGSSSNVVAYYGTPAIYNSATTSTGSIAQMGTNPDVVLVYVPLAGSSVGMTKVVVLNP